MEPSTKITGTQSKASNSPPEVIPLRQAPEKETVTVVKLSGGYRFKRHLESLGLYPGSFAQVIQNTGFGPLILSVKGARIGLGDGMSRRVQVTVNSQKPDTRTASTSEESSPPYQENIPPHISKPLNTVTLSTCREGDRVRIVRILGKGFFRNRLQEMGLLKGAEIMIQKYAPMRDPMELVIKGYHLSIRVEEADRIFVQPLSR
jgi:Fur family ferric uptake transcriptional regulator